MWSKDSEIRFISQFLSHELQTFSWLLSSGACGTAIAGANVAGDLEFLDVVPSGPIEDKDLACAPLVTVAAISSR